MVPYIIFFACAWQAEEDMRGAEINLYDFLSEILHKNTIGCMIPANISKDMLFTHFDREI